MAKARLKEFQVISKNSNENLQDAPGFVITARSMFRDEKETKDVNIQDIIIMVN